MGPAEYISLANTVIAGIGVTIAAVAVWSMREAAEKRNRQLDDQHEALMRQGEVLASIGQGIQELLRRSDKDA